MGVKDWSSVLSVWTWSSIVLIIAIVFGLVYVVFTSFTKKLAQTKFNSPVFLIVGPSYSGKTALFNYWTTNTVSATVTSQQSNYVPDFPIPFNSENVISRVGFVDLPGHPKLQFLTDEYINKHPRIRGIIFMVDAAGGAKEIDKAGELLFNILVRTESRMGGVDILVAANKSDLFNMVPANRLKGILEKKIDELRSSKIQGVGLVGETNDEPEKNWIGVDSGQGGFKFEQLEGEVTVLDGSVIEKSVTNWQTWVEEREVN